MITLAWFSSLYRKIPKKEMYVFTVSIFSLPGHIGTTLRGLVPISTKRAAVVLDGDHDTKPSRGLLFLIMLGSSATLGRVGIFFFKHFLPLAFRSYPLLVFLLLYLSSFLILLYSFSLVFPKPGLQTSLHPLILHSLPMVSLSQI